MRPIALLLACAGLALVWGVVELRRGAVAPEEEPPAGEPGPLPVSPPGPVPSAPARQAESPAPAPRTDSVYYQYVDEAGRVQFASSLDEVPPEWRAAAGRVSVPVAVPGRARAAAGAGRSERTLQPVIEIYTLKSCVYCRAAMAYMDAKGLEYTNRDLDEEPEATEEYLEKTDGRRGVPVIDVEGEIMQGWNARQFESLLAAARR